MGRVRAALAVGNKPVLDLTKAQSSRLIYEHMRRHDEAFFRAWRLADRPQSPQTPEELMVQADTVWAEILAIAVRVYGGERKEQESRRAAEQQIGPGNAPCLF
jgi:hypothetical protein